jgi:hypothetical protein
MKFIHSTGVYASRIVWVGPPSRTRTGSNRSIAASVQEVNLEVLVSSAVTESLLGAVDGLQPIVPRSNPLSIQFSGIRLPRLTTARRPLDSHFAPSFAIQRSQS